jgi:hypothetical protein
MQFYQKFKVDFSENVTLYDPTFTDAAAQTEEGKMLF